MEWCRRGALPAIDERLAVAAALAIMWALKLRCALSNRQPSASELERLFAPLITKVRRRLADLSGGNEDLLWLFRRKSFREVSFTQIDQ